MQFPEWDFGTEEGYQVKTKETSINYRKTNKNLLWYIIWIKHANKENMLFLNDLQTSYQD